MSSFSWGKDVITNCVDSKVVESMTMPYFELAEQIDLMIRARYPILYAIAVEEEPLEEVLFQVAARSACSSAESQGDTLTRTLSQPVRQVLFWDVVRGWSDNGADKGSVMAALSRIGKTDAQKSVMFRANASKF